MSWTGEYWGKNGAVAFAKQRFESSQKESTDYVAYASVCYSAANRVFADVSHLRWDGIKRLVTGYKLARLSVRLTDKIVLRELRYPEVEDDVYANALDIGCAIYARYGWLCGSYYRERLGRWVKCASDLVDTCKARDCYIHPHTKAFLILHKIRFEKVGLKFQSLLYSDLEDLAEKSEESGELAQASRIFRQLAGVIDGYEYEKRYCLNEAKRLAEEAGATDQLAKI